MLGNGNIRCLRQKNPEVQELPSMCDSQNGSCSHSVCHKSDLIPPFNFCQQTGSLFVMDLQENDAVHMSSLERLSLGIKI